MKALLEIELLALSSFELATPNLIVADTIRHMRLCKEVPTSEDIVESYYSSFNVDKNGILTYITPKHHALVNCKGCGTDFAQAYIDYCERLAVQFKLLNRL